LDNGQPFRNYSNNKQSKSLIRIETTYNINSICPDLVNRSKKEGLLFIDSILFFVVFNKKTPIAFFGLKIGTSSAVLKCAYVIKEYRRQGLLKKLTLYRLQFLKKNMPSIKEVSANTTKMATGVHLSIGAKEIAKYKNGITKIKYEL